MPPQLETRNLKSLFFLYILLPYLRVYDIFAVIYDETHRVEPSSSRNPRVS